MVISRYLIFIFSFHFYFSVEFKPKCITCMNITDGPFGNDVYSFNQLHFHWGSDNDHGTEHEIIGKQ